MIRSMLRDDPLLADSKIEHAPIVEAEWEKLLSRDGVSIRPLKFGNFPGFPDCLAMANAPHSVGLILHRKDWAAQAASHAVARVNRSWFGKARKMQKVTVDWDAARSVAQRINDQLAQLQSALAMPSATLAYEDISVSTLKAALEPLLEREIVVSEPSTVPIRSAQYVANWNKQ